MIEQIKYLLFLSMNKEFEINIEEILDDSNFLNFFQRLFSSIFQYNEEKDFNKKIDILEKQWNKNNFKKYLKIDFQILKNLLLDLYNCDYSYDYCIYLYNKKDNYKGSIQYAYLYIILLIINDKNFIFIDKIFTLDLIEQIETLKNETNSHYENLFIYLFKIIILNK